MERWIPSSVSWGSFTHTFPAHWTKVLLSADCWAVPGTMSSTETHVTYTTTYTIICTRHTLCKWEACRFLESRGLNANWFSALSFLSLWLRLSLLWAALCPTEPGEQPSPKALRMTGDLECQGCSGALTDFRQMAATITSHHCVFWRLFSEYFRQAPPSFLRQ